MGVRFIWTFGVIMQEWTTILTPGGLVVTVQRRGQNGYFALSIDGLVTMRRGSQDSTGRADWMQQLAAVERKAWKAWKAWASMAALSIISLSSSTLDCLPRLILASVSVTLCIRTLPGGLWWLHEGALLRALQGPLRPKAHRPRPRPRPRRPRRTRRRELGEDPGSRS